MKIHSVEIEAFRAYKDKQIFDFKCQSGNLANLIVLYAPNGFGKTSFFDAVEWSITGKINRITKNSAVKSIADDEQGNIIKNTESSNLFGKVKIIGDDENILEVQTKILGEYNRKTDYCEGDYKTITSRFQELKKVDVSSTNLLTHDKIDSFLRFSTAKERYETLSSFWDINNDTDTYKAVYALYKESVVEEETLVNEISNLEKGLGEISFTPEKIKHLSSLIKTINNKYNLELDEALEIGYKRNLDKCLNRRTTIINLRATLNEKMVYLEALIKDFDQYTNKSKEINILKLRLKEKEQIQVKYEILAKEEKQLYVLKEDHNKKKGQLAKYSELLSGWDAFELTEKELNGIYISNLNVSKEISELNAEGSKIELHIMKAELFMKELEAKRDIYTNTLFALEQKYNDYSKLKHKGDCQTDKINKLKKAIDIRISRIDMMSKKSNELEAYIRLEDKSIVLNKPLYIEFHEAYLTCNRIYQVVSKLSEKIRIKEQEYIKYGEINNQLNDIIKYGKSFIEQTKPRKCPLCSKEYETFQVLLNNVNNALADSVGVDKIFKELSEIKKTYEGQSVELEKSLGMLKLEIENKIRNLDFTIKRERMKIGNDQSLLYKKQDKLGNYHFQKIRISQYFSKIEIDIENCDLDTEKNRLNNTILDYRTSIVEQAKKVELLKKSFIISTEVITKKKGIIEAGNSRASELKWNSKYINTSNLLAALVLDKNEVNPKELVKQQMDLVKKGEKELDEINISITNLKNKLSDFNEDELARAIVIIKNKIVLLEDESKSFEERYKGSMRDASNISLIVLQEAYAKNLSKFEEYENVANDLMEIIEHLNYLSSNIEWGEKSKKLASRRTMYERVTVAKKELREIKDTSIKYISKNIDAYFNVDTINQIYGKIEPHPNLNYVKFEPEFSRDIPELRIRAYNKDSSEGMAPILYLSSAQVNILSLSVFLAKSLQENNILNTIFMDDPIQHLDSINILSFIDLLRTITSDLDRQVVISTHNESFYRLLMRKIGAEHFDAMYIELGAYGTVRTE